MCVCVCVREREKKARENKSFRKSRDLKRHRNDCAKKQASTENMRSETATAPSIYPTTVGRHHQLLFDGRIQEDREGERESI